VLVSWSFGSGHRTPRLGGVDLRLGVGGGFLVNDFRKGPTFRAIEDSMGFEGRVEVDECAALKLLLETDVTLSTDVVLFADLGLQFGVTSFRAYAGEVVIVPDTRMNLTGGALEIGLAIALSRSGASPGHHSRLAGTEGREAGGDRLPAPGAERWEVEP